jgi:AcrR family transcriptional regulator
MFSMLDVRSIPDDRTARAIIRDEALRLFAARGPDAVTVRQIAAAAGVSPGLVIHHFGSKKGLCEVVDRHVLATFEAMFDEMTAQKAPDLFDPSATGSVTELMAAHLPPHSPVPAYLRRLLLTESDEGRVLFRRLFDASQTTLAALARAGLASSGQNPAVRAAVLLANDLAVLLLRDRLADVLGVDPLSHEGMTSWASEMLTIYGTGLFTPEPPSTPGHPPSGAARQDKGDT